jgi:hypothetical protein
MRYHWIDLDDIPIRSTTVSNEPLQSLCDASMEDFCDASIGEIQAAVFEEARKRTLMKKYSRERWSKKDNQ